MQRVISRVHQIVTSGADAPASASASLEGLAAAASAAPPVAQPSPGNAPAASAPASASTPSFSPSARAAASSSAPSAATHAAPAPVANQKEIALAVERLQYATLLGERKKAVASLHELARTYASTAPGDGTKRRALSTPDHVALGLAAIPVVLNSLLSDPRDTELMEAMLELLQEFVATSPATASAMLKPPPPPATSSAHGSLRSAAAAAATVSMSGTQLCLQLLQDPSPWIRGPTIALVKCMQEAQQKEFAASVLDCKEGLRRLLEVVEDKREHIRDAALQVLVKMTEREKNVQQFLAFEDGFVRLFQIMEVEGLHEGSSVVSDCLQIVNNMLRDNLMNQTLFRDLPYLSTHLPKLLSLPSTSNGGEEEAQDGSIAPSALKSTQKKRTMKLVLQLVRFLVSALHEGVPDSKLDELALREKARKDHEIAQIQSMITRQSELMGAIGEIVCCGNEELTDLQLQALDMIQLLCSGNGGNQIILVNLQTIPTRRSLLSELIKLDIAEDETPVSAAATNLLDVLFTKNESAKMAIFQHLNAPPPIEDDVGQEGHEVPVPAGRVLLDALITNVEAVVIVKGNQTKKSIRSSTITAWKACHRFASLLADSAYCKELALRIPSQFEKPDVHAVSGDLFITRCLKILSASSPIAPSRSCAVFQVKIAILTMLIQWCVGCTNAVRELTGSVTTLAILVDTLAIQGDGEQNTTMLSKEEIVQVRGLAAVLLGACLEFLVPAATEVTGAVSPRTVTRPNATPQLTRHNLVDLISKKIGLESFANMLIHFQQSPQVVACARAASKNQRARGLLPHRALYSGEVNEDDDIEGYLFPLYDRSFTVLCRDLADKIQHRVLSIFTSADEDEVNVMGGNGANVPSAASAYQDLIRMQDKQIQELQLQVADLAAQVQVSSSEAEQTSHVKPDLRSAQVEAEIQRLKAEHEQETHDLNLKLTAVTEQSTTLESRLQGVSRALEHLEAEHSLCGQRQSTGGVYTASSSTLTDAMAKVMVDYERETAERRRLEHELRQLSQIYQDYEKKSAQETHTWQMANLQLQQELDKLRASLTEKEEQLNEQSEMIDVFRQGQESSKRSAAQLKLDLDRANIELAASRTPSAVSNESPSSKHEAAAMEMYQLWEKERAKVRDLKTELESLELALSNASSRCQELETRLAEDERERIPVTDIQQPDFPVQIGGNREERTASQDIHHELDRLSKENADLEAKLSAMESDKDEQISRLNSALTKQLDEIDEVRALLKDMHDAAEEAAQQVAAKEKTIEDLHEELTQAEERAHDQRKKAKATVAELEGEISRMFFEKTETQRKSKASLKQVEQEIARMFLEKVELEKEIARLKHAATVASDAQDVSLSSSAKDEGHCAGSNGSRMSQDLNATVPTMIDTQAANQTGVVPIDEATAMDDMFIVLASLEIQCNTFRECLEAARGEQAVVEAVQMSRKRGALVI